MYKYVCSCCVGSAAVCSDWKARNGREGGKLFTDWCNYPGQICTANGTLLRLDMRGYNLQCPFPATDLAVFTSLTTLNLGRNPNMTVRSPGGLFSQSVLQGFESAVRVSGLSRCKLRFSMLSSPRLRKGITGVPAGDGGEH